VEREPYGGSHSHSLTCVVTSRSGTAPSDLPKRRRTTIKLSCPRKTSFLIVPPRRGAGVQRRLGRLKEVRRIYQRALLCRTADVRDESSNAQDELGYKMDSVVGWANVNVVSDRLFGGRVGEGGRVEMIQR
jgi:hypothetical protein